MNWAMIVALVTVVAIAAWFLGKQFKTPTASRRLFNVCVSAMALMILAMLGKAWNVAPKHHFTMATVAIIVVIITGGFLLKREYQERPPYLALILYLALMSALNVIR